MMRRTVWCISAVVVSISANAEASSQSTPPASQNRVPRDTFDAWMTRLSNAQRWGPQDQLGTLNLITPAKRRAAAQSVRDGISISLANDLVAGPDSNAIGPFRFGVLSGGSDTAVKGAIDTLGLIAHGWVYTHMDAIGHFAYRGRMYNGFGSDQFRPEGLGKLGIETLHAGIVTRGVLVDMPRLKTAPFLPSGMAIMPADLEAWERANGTRIETGDVVLIRTGRAARTRAIGPWRVNRGAAGPHPSLAAWLKERGVAALGSDVANELYPSVVAGVEGPLHILAIVGLGMPLFDNLDLEAVADEALRRSRPTFLFVVGPLRIRGGTGSPVNPLAIF